ncbi:hypothetical protein HDE68_002063 [Pedobacter cryoconitis]|uniref:Uncharacterized protein n=1 Tax=Pedobacter cryoconitis TaxID=188932 RepID=A0A7W9E026_9SPHI|nr:hypothetical protein [Pedobacter cryoconitis]MBB5636175.1 hypothetical protein [Pedobacter cryoconitis]
MGKTHSAAIHLLKPFRKKYLFTITSNLSIGGIVSESKVEVRWMLELKKILADGYHFEFITIDNTMVYTNNDGFIEIHHLVNQLQKALNEVEFISDFQGRIKQILNKEVIREKWESVRKEALAYNKNMSSLNDLFALQSESFNNGDALNKMIGALEFFEFYFSVIYGRSFPFRTKIRKGNVFKTTEIPFEVSGSSVIDNEGNISISFRNNEVVLKDDELKKAYGNFPFIDIKEIKPDFKYSSDYVLDSENGYVREALIVFKEYISPELNAAIIYKINSYG